MHVYKYYACMINRRKIYLDELGTFYVTYRIVYEFII